MLAAADKEWTTVDKVWAALDSTCMAVGKVYAWCWLNGEGGGFGILRS